MDKHEAERLATAIRNAPVDWIKVQAVEWNQTANTYEIRVRTSSRPRGSSLLGRPSGLTPLAWIDVLTRRNDDLRSTQD